MRIDKIAVRNARLLDPVIHASIPIAQCPYCGTEVREDELAYHIQDLCSKLVTGPEKENIKAKPSREPRTCRYCGKPILVADIERHEKMCQLHYSF